MEEQKVLTNGKTESEMPDYRDTTEDGQQKAYVILSDEERAKGFVRPVRMSYRHVGRPAPKHPLTDLTPEQLEHFKDVGYIKFERYPEDGSSLVGRYWTQADLERVNRGCRTLTTMSRPIAETYARNPHFYGATFCCHCGKHLPVGRDGEFIWADGSNERVGT